MNNKRIITTLILALFTAGQSGTLLATTYKWADANGGIHYSQVPPTGSNITILEVSGKGDQSTRQEKPAATGKSHPETKEDSDKQYNVLVPEQADPEALAKAEAAHRKQQQEACDALRNNLHILQQNTRIRIRNGDNDQPRVLTPEERKARMQQYSESIDKMCK